MKKSKLGLIFFILSFFPSVLFSQNYFIKQITDFEFDCRNASFLVYPNDNIYFTEEVELFFESWEDSFSNIYSLKYNVSSDSFYYLRQFSTDGYLNRNAVAQDLFYIRLLVYHTILVTINYLQLLKKE